MSDIKNIPRTWLSDNRNHAPTWLSDIRDNGCFSVYNGDLAESQKDAEAKCGNYATKADFRFSSMRGRGRRKVSSVCCERNEKKISET